MSIRILTVTLGVAWAVTLIGIIWLLAIAGLHPRHLLSWLSVIELGMQLCGVLSIGSVVVGIVNLRAGARRRAVIGFASAFGWGVLGALYGASGARNVLINMNPPIPFYIYAPAYAEALVVLLVGLTGTLLGLALLSRSSSSNSGASRAG